MKSCTNYSSNALFDVVVSFRSPLTARTKMIYYKMGIWFVFLLYTLRTVLCRNFFPGDFQDWADNPNDGYELSFEWSLSLFLLLLSFYIIYSRAKNHLRDQKYFCGSLILL